MTNNTSESFLELAQGNTRVFIDGMIVNAAEVGFDPEQAGEIPIEIHIGSEALCHELNEAGVAVSLAELEGFVQSDLAENPKEAIAGYLGIAQGILFPPRAKRLFGIFTKKEHAPIAKWHVTGIKDVLSSGSSIVLKGVARLSGR